MVLSLLNRRTLFIFFFILFNNGIHKHIIFSVELTKDRIQITHKKKLFFVVNGKIWI